jgi:hypothetical protein
MRLLRARPLVLWLGLWFLVAGREPPFPHPCEMGGGHGAAAQHDAPAAVDAHAHHHHGAEPTDATQPAAPADAPAGHCECVDACCVTLGVLPSGGPSAPQAVLAVHAPRRIAAVGDRAPSVPLRLLPYANGPPTLS